MRDLEHVLAAKHGIGRREPRPARLTLVLILGGLLSLACPAHASTGQGCQVGAWTASGPAGCGIMIGTRAYMPGLTLTPDLALYVGESEEPAEFSMCLQHAHGVVCQGVQE